MTLFTKLHEITGRDLQLNETQLDKLFKDTWNPSNFLNRQSIIQYFPQLLERFPWLEVYSKIQSIQASSNREEYDPWKTDFTPLIKKRFESGLINPSNPADLEIIYQFISKFGMSNLPTIFKWFVTISNAHTIEELPPKLKTDFSRAGLHPEKFTQPKELINELIQLMDKLLEDLLHDKIPEQLESSSTIKELISMQTNLDGKWSSLDRLDPIIKHQQKTQELQPQLLHLPDGYEEISLNIPFTEEQELDESQQNLVLEKKQEILSNPDLQDLIAKYRKSYEIAFKDENIVLWWHNTLELIKNNCIQEIEFLQTKQKELPNEKAQFNIDQQIESLLQAQRFIDEALKIELSAQTISSERTMALLMEGIADKILEKISGRNDFLRTLSAIHSVQIIKSTFPQRLNKLRIGVETDKLDEQQLEIWNSHIVEYMYEHYLGSNATEEEGHTEHTPFSENLHKSLGKVWNIPGKIEKSKIFQSKQAFDEVEKNESQIISPNSMNVTLVPVRGLLRSLSGNIGDACYSRLAGSLAQGKFPEITSFVFVTNRNSPKKRIVGSVLIIETRTKKNEPTMVIRANNPRENLLSQISSAELVKAMESAFSQLAEKRGLSSCLTTIDYNVNSNRQKIATETEIIHINQKNIRLKNRPETNFNDRPIWKKNKRTSGAFSVW